MTPLQIKANLERMNDILLKIELDIVNKNNGANKQFDFCTHPNIATVISRLEKRIKSIYNKFYQD